MRVRFGYVAISLAIKEGSPNRTTTIKALEKIIEPADRVNRIRRITRENLETTLRILRYNAAHEIHLYRFTSKIVPLATHPLTEGWDYVADFLSLWQEIGEYIRSHDMRVSAHPDHYTLLNSPRAEVLTASLVDLDYHARLFEAMGFSPFPSLVLHVGGLYKERASSIARFIDQFEALPDRLKLRLMIENDDKIYTASEVLSLCEKLGCPMILDLHHHRCNAGGENLEDLWPKIASTWYQNVPKIHISSPKSEKGFRSHADYIDPGDILPFLKTAKQFDLDFDVMVEAKQKDFAMFQLVKALATEPGIRQTEQATIEL